MKKAGNMIKEGMQNAFSPIRKFMHIEASGGIVLLLSSIIALIASNSFLSSWYFQFINTPVSVSIGGFELTKTLLLYVNDGLMAIFFYLVGLEIKREILSGELSSPQKASFAIFAAIGGMLFPALIYVFTNLGGSYTHAWGVPMATDIAFALGILTLLGKRVPVALKIFLLALAIVDDLGAISVIALFYTEEIASNYLGFAGLAMFLLFLLNFSGLRNIAIGLALGLVTWFCFLKSGVHATIAGVMLAFLTPTYRLTQEGKLDKSRSMVDEYIHALHPWSAFLIMPIFAFFNAGVSVQGIGLMDVFQNPVSLGIILGLVLGNPIGITLLTFTATKLKIAEKPKDITWSQVFSVGFLAGIGFTMSLFISSLAFTGMDVEAYSKLGILTGSIIAMVLGLSLTYISTKNVK